MQPVLSIDLTQDPVMAQVVEVSGRTVKIIEVKTTARPDLFSETTPEAEHIPGTNGSSPVPQTRFKQFLDSFQYKWTSSIVILPPKDYLSLNMDLPFSDPKQISKILPLEVQDRVPFDVGEFLVEHHTLGEIAETSTSGAPHSPPPGSQDIHVSLIPKDSIRKLLTSCSRSELEPVIVSTPTSILGGLYFVAPEFLAEDSAIVLIRDPYYYVAIAEGRKLKIDRVLKRTITPHDEPEENPVMKLRAERDTLTEVKLTLSAFEHRYGKTLQSIYVLGANSSREDLQKYLGRAVELLEFDQLFYGNSANGETSTREASLGENDPFVGTTAPLPAELATLAAVFAQDLEAPPILTNFRVHEFSYSPRLKELYRGLSALSPYFLFAALFLALSLGGIYYSRQRYIDQVRSSMAAQIKASMPNIDIPEGLEVEALRGQLNKLQDQLKDLGSLSRFSPLDTLVQITKDFPTVPDVAVRSINIKNSRVKLEGTAPDYAAVENIEKKFKAKKELYSRVKSDVSSTMNAGSNGRTFTLEIILAD